MSKNKRYYDFLSEISSDELYKGLLAHGLFTEKMPPVFSSESFYNYCTTQTPTFPKKASEYVYHESMRNINTPRPLGMLDLIMQIVARLNEINDGSFVVEDLESERLRAL